MSQLHQAAVLRAADRHGKMEVSEAVGLPSSPSACRAALHPPPALSPGGACSDEDRLWESSRHWAVTRLPSDVGLAGQLLLSGADWGDGPVNRSQAHAPLLQALCLAWCGRHSRLRDGQSGLSLLFHFQCKGSRPCGFPQAKLSACIQTS